MTKAIFIILTLAGFASGAEMEVTDRLSVDGSMLLKSTLTVTGAGIEVRSGTSTAYSLAVGTSTNYSLTVSSSGVLQVGGDAQFNGAIYKGTYTVVDTSMLDDFTVKFSSMSGSVLKVADRLEQNTSLLAFKLAVESSLSKFNMVDGIMDDFEDQTGVDAANSVNQSYDSANHLYSPAKDLGGNDGNTKLLLHANGGDEGNSGYNITSYGTAQIVADQKKFGIASLKLNGSSDYITAPDSGDWYFGTGDFTIDFWVRFNSLNNYQWLVSQCVDGSNEISVSKYSPSAGNKLAFWGVHWTGVNTYEGYFEMKNSWPANVDQWYHLAFVRNGINAYIFIDGAPQELNQLYAWGTMPDISAPLCIGARGVGTNYTNGYIDEFRVSKGIARWTSDFTPSTFSYTSDFYTNLLLHFNDGDSAIGDGHPLTYISTAHVDSDQKKFGIKSMKFDGGTDYVTSPYSPDFGFDGDFTVDMWIYPASLTGVRSLAGTLDWNIVGSPGWALAISGVNLVVYGCEVYSNLFGIAAAHGMSINNWYHIALVRNGTSVKIYVNGVEKVSGTNTPVTNWTRNAPLYIGRNTDNAAGYFSGYIDEVRISKSIARWTTDFTPPVSQYTDTNFTYNMSLKSNNTTAESTPAKARIVLFEEDVDTCTLNTDIKASVSRDNGTTYSTATLADEGDWSTGKRILSGLVDISTQPSGTNMKWRVDTSNNRDMKLHGVGLNWD